MKIVAVVSGKGGAGKSLFSLALREVTHWAMVDADVDEPNLAAYLGLSSPEEERVLAKSRRVRIRAFPAERPRVVDLCPTGALEWKDGLRLRPYLCEGCGLCVHLHPHLFSLEEVPSAFLRFFPEVPLLEGRTRPGFTGSGKAVEALLQEARHRFQGWVITDGPPGSDCPTISLLREADAVVVVVEDSLSGLADAKRVFALAQRFGKRGIPVVNKWRGKGWGAAARIPFLPDLERALSSGEPVWEFPEFLRAAERVRDLLEAGHS